MRSVQCSGAELNWTGQYSACRGVKAHARVITLLLITQQTETERELHCNIHLTYTPFTRTAHARTNISCNLMLLLREMLVAVRSKINVWFVSTHLLVRGPMKGLQINCTVALEANNRPTFTFSLRSCLSALGQSDLFWGGITEEAGVIGLAVLICGLKPVRRVVLSYRDTMLWKVPDGDRGDMEWFWTDWAASSSIEYR